jgi:hypothetical protein
MMAVPGARILEVTRGTGTMCSQLVVIRVFYGDQVSNTANIAWIGLSNACHHHAYELTPTVEEVRHWLGLVALTRTANKVRST